MATPIAQSRSSTRLFAIFRVDPETPSIANLGEAFTFSNANDLAAFNLYGYNGRSEVASAARYWGTDVEDTSSPVLGQEYAYEFDPIGNRITADEGATSRTASYTANAINQYSQRSVPAVKELAGTALTNAMVTVNDLPTDRHGPWWSHALSVDTASAAAYDEAIVTAVHNPPGTNTSDVVTSATGHVFVAKTPETFTYDNDGNLLSDGRFTYAWDAENRLISVTTRADLPASVPRIRLRHAYDYQWRRLATVREAWDGQDWQPVATNRFVFDGWNLVASIDGVTTNSYTWGLDLSGTLQGAGGIGGLLARHVGGSADCYAFDGNGNVGQLVAEGGSLAAHYEYGPFGQTVVAAGPNAAANPFRFSTKWKDDACGLVWYGYRWYGPEMGRWFSRDPIGESDGPNLMMHTRNSPICNTDGDGRHTNRNEPPSVSCLVPSLIKTYPVQYIGSSYLPSGRKPEVLTKFTVDLIVAGWCPATGGLEDAPICKIPWGKDFVDLRGNEEAGKSCRIEYKCVARCKAKCCSEWSVELYKGYVAGHVVADEVRTLDPYDSNEWKNARCSEYPGHQDKNEKACIEAGRKYCEGQVVTR